MGRKYITFADWQLLSKIRKLDDIPNTFFHKLPRAPGKRGNRGTKAKKVKYKNVVCAFDIETTRLLPEEQAIMYHWCFAVGIDTVICGRTWDEFLALIRRIETELGDDIKLVTYVHNLSYEFTFLSGIWDFEPDDVFCIDRRKILKAVMGPLELRCSYLHSNMSLAEYTDKMHTRHGKLSGDLFDYDVQRYPWTPLSAYETLYCINDVIGLVEAVCNEMSHDSDTLHTIPLTSTGYVRRDVKRAMRQMPFGWIAGAFPEFDEYVMLREAFRGGNTHANRWHAGIVMENVKTADLSSAYPGVQCTEEFPVGPFFPHGKISSDEVMRLITVRHKALLMRVALRDVKLSDRCWGCPYLAKDKCRHVVNGIFDNGRILSADWLETTITDVDLRIIVNEYDAEIIPLDVRSASYGRLPDVLLDVIRKYFTAKTELKGVTGEEVFYMKSKNKLNGIYGMSAQDPVKDMIKYVNGEFLPEGKDPEELLDKVRRKAWFLYQWGVWTTAWSRYRLEQGLQHVPPEQFVYCDTDSIKYIGDVDWEMLNADYRTRSEQVGAFATDPTGEVHYMGVYEEEGVADKFITLGAKKYAAQYGDKLKTTIAGVNKRKGGPELQRAGGIEAFKEGFIFREAGGNELVYNDDPEIKVTEREGRLLRITRNVVIRPSSYTLGITGEYERLLRFCRLDIQGG